MNTTTIDNMITYLEGLEPGSPKPLWSFNEIFATPGVDQSHYPWDGSIESLLELKTTSRFVLQAPYGYINGVAQGTNERPKCVATIFSPLSSGGEPCWHGVHEDLAIAIAIAILRCIKSHNPGATHEQTDSV